MYLTTAVVAGLWGCVTAMWNEVQKSCGVAVVVAIVAVFATVDAVVFVLANVAAFAAVGHTYVNNAVPVVADVGAVAFANVVGGVVAVVAIVVFVAT